MNACRKRSMTLRSFKARSFLLEIKGCRGVRRGSWAAPRGGDGGEDGAAARPNLACRPAGASRACRPIRIPGISWRSEEHTSELQSLLRNSYAVFCLKKQKYTLYKTKS